MRFGFTRYRSRRKRVGRAQASCGASRRTRGDVTGVPCEVSKKPSRLKWRFAKPSRLKWRFAARFAPVYGTQPKREQRMLLDTVRDVRHKLRTPQKGIFDPEQTRRKRVGKGASVLRCKPPNPRRCDGRSVRSLEKAVSLEVAFRRKVRLPSMARNQKGNSGCCSLLGGVP